MPDPIEAIGEVYDFLFREPIPISGIEPRPDVVALQRRQHDYRNEIHLPGTKAHHAAHMDMTAAHAGQYNPVIFPAQAIQNNIAADQVGVLIVQLETSNTMPRVERKWMR